MKAPLSDSLKSLANRLRRDARALQSRSVVAGFDGFVDEMIQVVQTRQSLDSFAPVPTIEALGRMITASARQSSLREIVVNAQHPGGCTVNSADALASLGVVVDAYATMGIPRLPVFDKLAEKCRNCVSWGDVGRTLAFEFSDGKLMFSNMQTLAKFDETTVRNGLADGGFLRQCCQASLILLTDWSLYPHMTDCWGLLRREVFSKLENKPSFFIDLVDPSSRSHDDVRAMMDELSRMQADCGDVNLGLNGNEVRCLASAAGLPVDAADDSPEGLGQLAQTLRQHMKIARTVVHRYRFSLCADDQGVCVAPAPFCAAPKKSTGAGDRFNAGFIAGVLLDENVENRLLLGNACSGYFVRHAHSACAPDLADFLDAWGDGRLPA